MAIKKTPTKKKSPAKKAPAKKAPAKKAPAKKTPAKKAVVKKAVAKKAVAKKAVAKKAVAKKAVAKKAVAKAVPEKKAIVSKTPVIAPAKKVVVAPVKKPAVKKTLPTKKSGPPKLEENTFLNLKIAKVMHEDPREFHDDHEQAPEIEHEPLKPIVRETPKVGRNEPCPCGSGAKYKKCHGKES